MRRRDVLAGLVAVASAGCTGSPGASNGTTTEEPTTTEQLRIGDTSFELTGAGCGVVTESASVSVTAGTVSVTGTTSAPSGCYTAELADVTYDSDADELRVVVAAVERDGVEGCVQCITEIDYETSISFDNGLPGRVVVLHRSRGEEREVATATSL